MAEAQQQQPPWWANHGHQRALAQRNARMAKSRRSWSMVGCGLIAWVVSWIFIATMYMWTTPGTPQTTVRSTSASSASMPNLQAGVQEEGFSQALEGFLFGRYDPPRTLDSLSYALRTCTELEDCGGVTVIPFAPVEHKYELRTGRANFMTTDGQMSFMKLELSLKGGVALDKLDSSSSEQVRSDIDEEDEMDDEEREQLEKEEKEAAEEEQEIFGQISDSNKFITDDGENVQDGPWIIEELEGDSSFMVKFWRPPVDHDLENIDKIDDGQPTIFLGIASYRDQMCHETLERALNFAKYPSRLRFGVVEQNAPSDIPCFHTKVPCAEDPDQLLCKYRNNIRIHKVSARAARGPTFGRHRSDALYRGESFALQIDAHMYFIKYWDEDLLEQWRSTRNEYAVLSTYPTDFTKQTLNEKTGISPIKTTPIICHSKFVGANGMTKHQSAEEFRPPRSLKTPILQIWWAAGISFSRGHRIVRVPYDGYLPMLFDGEETSMAYRMWTHGYDFYTFHHSAVFHPYSRKNKPPLFWENADDDEQARKLDLLRSENRLLKIYGMEPTGEYDDRELARYGLGSRRPLGKFLKLFGIDYKKRTVVNYCDASRSASIHNALTPYLRADRRGIDYSRIQDRLNFRKAARRALRGLGEYVTLGNQRQLESPDLAS